MNQDGSICIRCPWIEEHSCDSGPTETVYFPAGTGDFSCGHFKCLHASHAGKTDADFLEAIGYLRDGFEHLEGAHDTASVVDALTADVPPTGTVVHPLSLPAFDRQPQTGKIKPHANNLVLFMNWLCAQGEGVRFDVFRDEIELSLPSRDGQGARTRPFTDADYTRLQVRAESGAAGFAPLAMDLLRRVVHMVAQNRCFDSAQDWLRAVPPWDGTPRITTFCSTYLGSADSPYTRAVGRYLWTAMPGRILAPGSQADMAVILVSAQGTGKSSSVRAMAPMRDYYIDLSLSDRDADLARLTRGKTLVELSELRGLHTKEMDSIKSFVTRLDSEWVPKYFEMRTVYQRRFVMIGTTNNDEFLGDVTGERRWLPLRVGVQRLGALTADHAQLWAEGRALYEREGILWREAQTLGAAEHAEFSIQDVWVDLLDDWLHREEFGETPASRPFLRMTEVMQDGLRLDAREGLRANQLRVADALRRLGYEKKQIYTNGRQEKVWMKKSPQLSQVVKESGCEFF